MSWDWEKLQQRQRHRQFSSDSGGGGGPQKPDLAILKDFFNKWGSFKLIGLIVALVILGWLATGFYTVQPGEVGVIQRFGAKVDQTAMGAGLQWHWPMPIERVTHVDTQRVRAFEIGFERVMGTKEVIRDEALMLTKDKNIAHFEVIIQYQLYDPTKYLFEVRQPDDVIKSAAESALRSVVGTLDIDRAIVAQGLAAIAEETQEMLQSLLDSYDSGLRVVNVRTERGDAPQEVREAFHDVVRALEDKERLIHKAEEYREDILPRARGERARRTLEAQGEIKRFGQLLDEYEMAKEVTRQRLYLETISRVFPEIEKVIVDEKAADTMLLFPEGRSEAAFEKIKK